MPMDSVIYEEVFAVTLTVCKWWGTFYRSLCSHSHSLCSDDIDIAQIHFAQSLTRFARSGCNKCKLAALKACFVENFGVFEAWLAWNRWIFYCQDDMYDIYLGYLIVIDWYYDYYPILSNVWNWVLIEIMMVTIE